jgi:hypothetical protein
MDSRFKSAIATVLIQGVLAYALIMGLAMTISRTPDEKLSAVTIAPKLKPPPPPTTQPPVVKTPPLGPPGALRGQAVKIHDWSAASAEQRNFDFMKVQKWRDDNMSAEERRLIKLRADLPQGSGPGKVVRLQPPDLPTHTLYWPANWTRGPLPIVAWGNDFAGTCSNSSLPYAAFLSEIASHGYFVVAVGNDDIDYPQPEGLAYLADGRPLRTKASALTKAVDWAVAESGRAGSPYRGKLDTGKVAYMGHGCGAGQALTAAADPRATTVVLLNSSAELHADGSSARKPPVAQFEGQQDDREVIEAGDANLAKARAAGWPILRAALKGVGHGGAYSGPDRRWSKAVVAWLDWQLKGDGKAEQALRGLADGGWSRVDSTVLEPPSG